MITINGRAIDEITLEIEEASWHDLDFPDAFFSEGYYIDGDILSDEDLELLTEREPSLLYLLSRESILP